MISYGIIGFNGKMGKVISEELNANGFNLVCSYDINHKVESGIPDLLIDFSLPDALEFTLSLADSFNAKLLIGTTGYTKEQLKQIKETSNRNPIMISYNYSIGVQLLIKCAKMINTKVPSWDKEIVDIHHNRKKDSPSGTALMIKKSLENEINISSLRIGGVVGEHSVYFGGSGETIQLKHSVISRKTFAEGVLKALPFLMSKKNGLYNFSDIFISED